MGIWRRCYKWALEHRYETIAVLNGALVMMLEIVGARMIAPYFGSSVYVWTAVVGVILGGLSLGYWYGGKLADQSAGDQQLALVLLMGAGVLLVVMVVRDGLLQAVAGLKVDIRAEAVMAALILFAPANMLMGMVSPYLVKLKLTSLSSAGSSVGGLYACGTVGSIAGVFATGYWLISWLGNRELGLVVVAGLVAGSWLAAARAYWWQRLLLWSLAALELVVPAGAGAASGLRLVYDGDSAYARMRVIDYMQSGRRLRILTTDNSSAESGIYLDNLNEPAFGYIGDFVRSAQAVAPRRVLVIGAGAYTFPRMLLQRFPRAQVDVVDIDPKMDEVAGKYFGYRPDPSLRVIHQDGRTFFNQNALRYDLVFMDAFSSVTPPFQLTTREAVAHIRESLMPGGAVVVNLVSAMAGPTARFGQAEAATYKAEFSYVRIGSTGSDRRPPQDQQNLLMVAGTAGGAASMIVAKVGPLDVASREAGPVLTDNFAPVEQWTAQ
jgi:spermidine synthase